MISAFGVDHGGVVAKGMHPLKAAGEHKLTGRTGRSDKRNTKYVAAAMAGSLPASEAQRQAEMAGRYKAAVRFHQLKPVGAAAGVATYAAYRHARGKGRTK